jgi:peptidoglycan/xylan/chitin deacetylase (PgdA/CDA1 family)
MIVYFNGDENTNEIALTFDDGPNPPRTERILDILDSFEVKATFFPVGKWIERFPDTLRETHRRGHLIGNHSYSHSKDVDDLKKCEDAIKKVTGFGVDFVRPPYGEWSAYSSLASMKEKKVIIFSFEPTDWQMPGVDKIVEYYLANTKNGSILTFHDGNHKEAGSSRPDQMIQALPMILEKLKDKFKIVRLNEMKLEPAKVG